MEMYPRKELPFGKRTEKEKKNSGDGSQRGIPSLLLFWEDSLLSKGTAVTVYVVWLNRYNKTTRKNDLNQYNNVRK